MGEGEEDIGVRERVRHGHVGWGEREEHVWQGGEGDGGGG